MSKKGDTEPQNIKITLLEAKKERLFENVQALYNLSLKVSDPISKTQFITRIQSLEHTRTEFIDTIDKLVTAYLESDPTLKPNYSVLNSFDELYCYAKHAEQEIKDSRSRKFQADLNCGRKLPLLELVSFDGTPNKWPVFYENFKCLIHDNTRLSDSEKAQYLVGKLSNSALTVCSGILPTGENYPLLWEALIKKYQDSRVQASLYVNQMLNYKSNQKIDSFIEQFVSAEKALARLKLPDLSDFIITHLALSKLDKEVVDLFEQTHRHIDMPTFENVTKFLNEQSKIQSLRNNSLYKTTSVQMRDNSKIKTTRSFVVNDSSSSSQLGTTKRQTRCVVCNLQIHPLFKCSEFMKLDPYRRNEIVSKHHFCRNCLGFHDIKLCKSNNRCFSCLGLHHSALHMNVKSNEKSSSDAVFPQPSAVKPVTSGARRSELSLHTSSDAKDKQLHESRTVLLPTAVVYVYGNNRRSNVRILVDTGSMTHFISKECCDRIGLSIKTDTSRVRGIGQIESACLGYTTFKIHSRFDKTCSYEVHARVLNSITDKLPNALIDTTHSRHFDNLFLADSQWEKPGTIDCLIGSALISEILGGDKIISGDSSLIALSSKLGYLVMGKANYVSNSYLCNFTRNVDSNADKSFFCSSENSQTLARLTERFWELESVPSKTHISPDDEACEQSFISTYSRDSSGRYEVQLPFKREPSELGNSYATAKRRLIILEKKLDACPDLRTNYNATIQEYIDKGYLNEVQGFKLDSECYYIPHRAVYRPDKQSTKTRVVLDASCATTSGQSLNDLLYKGPNLQSNIFELLINLRMFPTALSADIEKMYFQVKLVPEHHSFQRILYRFHPDSEIRIFEFNRIAFGLSSSPYLAMRCVRQLAADSREHYPLAAYEADHMYMDDYVNSIDGPEKAEEVYHEMVNMFKAGGFDLVKWISNDSKLMGKIPTSHRNPQLVDFDDGLSDTLQTKIIGMQWHPIDDNFQFQINADIPECSKRTILSVTARLFDPIGLISPVSAYLKLLVQDCWAAGLGWNDPVTRSIQDKWTQFRNELPDLKLIKIPRHVGINFKSHITVIGFGDASEACYGASVYIRVGSDSTSKGTVNLLVAKSKVAPLKKTTLARLELCAAVLLANLINAVREILIKRCTIDGIYTFSDSTVTLTWIHSPSYKFHTFVANRITEINSKLPACHWYKVKGSENPADIVSRPLTPRALLNCDMWFHGPHWLCDPIAQWPVTTFQVNSTESSIEEAKPVVLLTDTPSTVSSSHELVHPFSQVAERVSSWMKLLRVVVYVLRFLKRLPKGESITVADIDQAENYVVRYVQARHFPADLALIKNNKICSKRIIKLSPFIDNEGLLRAGGRLKNSELSYGKKHPIILPAKDRIVTLIVDYFHVANLHTGPSLLMALLRHKFWILSARNLIRQRVHACNICFRLKPRYSSPKMGDLPDFRVSGDKRCFVHSSVDYAGPFFTTHIRHRGVKSQKSYVCLFFCLFSSSIHAELVSSLSTELFLAAFKRFISRRGPVAMIYSDFGTNFCGARTQLDAIYDFIQSTNYENYISQNLLEQRIQFKHSPPFGPHFNGAVEANVRCVKTHLAKVIGLRTLTYEEFNTVLVQVEGLLNSRPLCVLHSDDPAEVTALTPNHFLNVTPLKFLPAEDLTEIPDNRLSRFELVSKLTHLFWQRWSKEYLTSLQQREKWHVTSNPINVGSVVIVKDQTTHPLAWPIGIVEEVYPGKDSVVRTCKVRIGTRHYIRPAVRLAPLPSQ